MSPIRDFAMQTIFTAWGYQVSWLELVAVTASLIGVWLGTTGVKWTWPWWALSSALYGWLFVEWDLLASASLQVVFIFAAIWGWFGWGPKGAQSRKGTPKQYAVVGILGIISWVILAPAFADIGAAATWPDSFGLVFSIVAQIIMVLQFRESWIVWLVVDAVYTITYARQGLWFTAALYVVFTLIAAEGYRKWLKQERLASATGLEKISSAQLTL